MVLGSSEGSLGESQWGLERSHGVSGWSLGISGGFRGVLGIVGVPGRVLGGLRGPRKGVGGVW